MRQFIIAAAFLVGLAAAPAGADAPSGTVYATATAERLAPEALIAVVTGTDLVIAGELHDNSQHHVIQAWLVAQLAPKGIAFEMIQQADEDKIARHLETGADPGTIGPLIGWDDAGWPAWALYQPIVEAAPDARITGGGVPRDALMDAIRKGAETVASPDLVPILTQPLDGETQKAMEDEMVAAHCNKLPAEMAPGMVQAQRLRDAAFAAASLRALEAGTPAVLITGNGHARKDRGVPVYLTALKPGVTIVSIGAIEVAPGESLTPAEIAAMPYDYVWLTAPEPREDPCKAFD